MVAAGRMGGQKAFRAIGMAGGLGFAMAILVLLGYYVGHTLDKRFGTDPWLMILCLMIGVGLGFVEFFRMTKRLFSPDTRNNQH